jgi:hypothetical protein
MSGGKVLEVLVCECALKFVMLSYPDGLSVMHCKMMLLRKTISLVTGVCMHQRERAGGGGGWVSATADRRASGGKREERRACGGGERESGRGWGGGCV